MPYFSSEFCARLREAFQRTGYDADGVLAAIGGQAHAALTRDEPELAHRASLDAGDLGTLIRLFLLGEPVPAGKLSEVLHPLTLGEALAGGLLSGGADQLRAALDVRPYQDGWLVSDLGSDRLDGPLPADHVPGVTTGSLDLVSATVRRHVDNLLDLGTGCGVQALHAASHAGRITATDTSARALALSGITMRLCQLDDVELLEGAWLTPVGRRRFDQVVCYPPLDAGPVGAGVSHQDSGLPGDEASALLVRQVPSVLNPGGVAQLRGAWLHRRGHGWTDRVGSWLPPTGVDAWFGQQEVVDPAQYVGDRLRLAGTDPRSEQGKTRARDWLDWFAANEVEGIGHGLVTLRNTAADNELTCEDLPGELHGEQVAGWLDRSSWLRAHATERELLEARLVVAEGTVLERTERPGEQGWQPVTRVLRETTGPGWRHELDDLACALVAGCRGLLPLEDLIGLLAAAHELPADELVRATLPAVRELIRHGMLLPAEVAG